jgi:hypothetical protein
MIELTRKTKEVEIKVAYSESIGNGVKVLIEGKGDLSHHLIEELFGMIDRLARMEKVGHQSEEWFRKGAQ